MDYVPLSLQSQYSILDSTLSVEEISKKAKELGLLAVALTDTGNLYGAIDFYKACKGEKIKPILGCKIHLTADRKVKKKEIGQPPGSPIILLAKNRIGYKNLSKLSSIGFLEGFYYAPRIDYDVLQQHAEGLIMLSGPQSGPLARLLLADEEAKAKEWIALYASLFPGNFYLQVERNFPSPPFDEEWLTERHRNWHLAAEKVNNRLIAYAKEMGLPLVATSDIRYLAPDDFMAHEVLMNVHSGETVEIWEKDSQGNNKAKVKNPKRDVLSCRDHYFKSKEEMCELFSDLPEAIQNTVKIAESIDLELDFKTRHYPVYVPETLQSPYTPEERLKAAETFLYTLCNDAIFHRYPQEALNHIAPLYPERDPLDVIRERFEYEFKILSSKGMCDYLLIVYDFIAWAKKKGIPVGPGRGSAAGSIVAYLSGITDIEPLRFHLFFERFINPERVSYPDIDVDICMERRQEVIDYTVGKYGADRVAQIITFGTMKAKMAVRDVGRALNVPLPKVNEIAALIPEDLNMTIEQALKIDPALREMMERDEEAKTLLEMAQKAEGSIRNTSTHAAGMIISGVPITDHVPVCTAKDSSMMVTQFAMKPVESIGMLKIDFLGLKTLTSLQHCTEAIEKRFEKKVDWSNLPLDDAPTFALLNQGKTLGIFQLESGGMQDLVQKLHIDRFEEIIAVGALYRPGPMDMIPSFIARKHGKEVIEFDHPAMAEVLKETYGVMVYQEQVMQIASLLAGYTLGEGDMLRRAMGKKDKEEMQRQREKFVQGAKKQGLDDALAVLIFDKIDKFASYGFNKSHAAAYAYLSFATAYFKANYPALWMASLMTSDSHDLTKVAKFIREAQGMGIALLPPDINESGTTFVAAEKGIRFAMSGVKGVGEGVVEAILEERKKGPFTSLSHFLERIDQSKVGKKTIDLLIDAGSFDFTGWTRDQLRLALEESYEAAFKGKREKRQGVLSLFSLLEPVTEERDAPLVTTPTPRSQILQREKELLGFYLTGHPMEGHKKVIERLACVPLKDLPEKEAITPIAFIVETIQLKISAKTQKKFAILTISDGMEQFEMPIWSDLYEEKQAILRENQLLFALVQPEKKEGALALQCRFVENLMTMNEEQVKRCEEAFTRLKSETKKRGEKKMGTPAEKAPVLPLQLAWDLDKMRLSHILHIKAIFRENGGPSPIEITCFSKGKRVSSLLIQPPWGVEKSNRLHDALSPFDFITKIG